MCGITGFSGSTHDETQLKEMVDSIRHRGPDAKGYYNNGNTFMGHCRLSILDLSEGANQPFFSPDKRYVVVFNGEIYNYKSIRHELEALGETFRTQSDTEVLLRAFILWGVDGVRRFIGMFAFAVLDNETEEIHMFRDRLGIKPLYYAEENGLVFASEFRAIIPMVSKKEINPVAVREYFRMGMICEDRTIFKNIKKLPAGSHLHYKDGKSTVTRYWEVKGDMPSTEGPLSEGEWKDKLHDLLVDAFCLRMVSDVPVGVFLSGGIDSSLVTAILQAHYGDIRTFTIGFDDPRFNEAPFAKQVADHTGTHHTELILEAKEAFSLLENFYDIYDEPFADSSGIPSAIISRLAAKNGIKVVLTAEGGDELFAGYNHYAEALTRYNKWQKLPAFARSGISKTLGGVYNSGLLKNRYKGNLEHRVSAVAELMSAKDILTFYEAQKANQTSSELDALLCDSGSLSMESYQAKDEMTQMMLQDLNYYLTDDLLVKMDRATMYNSIESREPFLDYRLVEMAFQMPMDLKYRNGKGKYILREILADYVPREMFERPKKGFSIPLFQWFSTEMKAFFEYYFVREKLDKIPVLNTEEVLREYKKYNYYAARGQEYNTEKIWRILSFAMWWDKWMGKALAY